MFIPAGIGTLHNRAQLPPLDESVWNMATNPPDTTAIADASSADVGLTLGMQFNTTVEGFFKSVCFWRWSIAQSPNGRVGIWRIDHGLQELVASVDFIGHSGTGWRKVDFPGEVPCSASYVYRVTVWHPRSDDGFIYYGSTRGWFNKTYYSPHNFIIAHNDSGRYDFDRQFSFHNGWYRYGEFACPNDGQGQSSYWVDVIVNGHPVPVPPDPPIVLKWDIPPGYPNLSNTGIPPGTVLTEVQGDLYSEHDGQIFEDLYLPFGGINIQHHNCIVRRCKIRYPGFGCVGVDFGILGCIIEDCDIDGVGRKNPSNNGVRGTWLAVRRCNIYRNENGYINYGKYGDGTVTQYIEDNFIHTLRAMPGAHYDCLQYSGGQSNIIVRHNTFHNEHTDTSATLSQTQEGPLTNLLWEDNVMCGGGFTIYCVQSFPPGITPMTNVNYYNNILRCGAFGYINNTGAEAEVGLAGNLLLDHGEIYDAAPPLGFPPGKVVRERFFGFPRGVNVAPGSVIGEAVPVDTGINFGISFTALHATKIVGVNYPKIRTFGIKLTYKIGVWRWTGSSRFGTTTLLGSATVSTDASGWLHLPLPTPIDINAGDNILVGLFCPRGPDGKVWYNSERNVFDDDVFSQFNRAIAFNGRGTVVNGFAGCNGTFAYGPDLMPPINQSASRVNYSVDPILEAVWT